MSERRADFMVQLRFLFFGSKEVKDAVNICILFFEFLAS